MASSIEIHPLFNTVILEKLFSLLPLQSLKNCRLTCKFWSRAALSFLQKSSKVILIRGGKADSDQYSFRNFLEFISSTLSYAPPSEEDPPSIPFANFYLDHWALNEKREKSLKLFWDICGPSMKHLHLSNVIFYEVETIRNILYHWSPNLESLKLENCLFYTITNEHAFSSQVDDAVKTEDFDEPNISYDYYDHVTVEQLKNVERNEEVTSINTSLVEFSYDQLEDEEFPLAWEEIFHAFPNIKRLNIALTTKAEQISKMLDALSTVRQDSNVMGSISALKFDRNSKEDCKLELNDAHLYKISDIICLPLTSLSLVVSKDIKMDSLLNLIRQYSPVLQKLCLHSEDEEDGQGSQELLEIFKYQRFPCLSNLCVSMSIVGENFNWLEIMPHLNKLHVWAREEEFSWETPIDDLILKSSRTSSQSLTSPSAMKSFSSNKNSPFHSEMNELSFGYTFANPQSVTLLCSWFANLRVLMMALTDEIIRVVFKEMKNLEEITVFDRFLTDGGITGNPISLSENTPWNPKAQREFPYIGDLKKLWKFTLTFRRYENITDLSVYQGFVHVPELSSLLLTRTKIGDKALNDLSMKSSLITMVTPTVCKGVEVEYAD